MLALICDKETETTTYCSPQSWMASVKSNRLIENKRAQYMENITMLPVEVLDKENTHTF